MTESDAWAADRSILSKWAAHADLSPLEAAAVRAAEEALRHDPGDLRSLQERPALRVLIELALGREPRSDPPGI